MRITEIENQLPNGLHDADLLEIRVDYTTGTAVLAFMADYSDAEGAGEPDRRVTLRISGLHFIDVPAPDLEHGYDCDGAPDVAGFLSLQESGNVNERIQKAATHLPSSAFCEAIFVTGWNDFIVIAAEDA